MCDPLSNERGQSLVLIGIGLSTTAFLALVVVGVDLGRLAFTAAEVQTVAESAATAAARQLMDTGVLSNTAANTVAGGDKVDGVRAAALWGDGSNPSAW